MPLVVPQAEPRLAAVLGAVEVQQGAPALACSSGSDLNMLLSCDLIEAPHRSQVSGVVRVIVANRRYTGSIPGSFSRR